ncbi:MAG: EAL domain-containing protein, partial [bacterium]
MLLYIDLVGMKFFNQQHGFAEGDRLLRAFSKLLIRTFNHDNCSHFDSDHFAVFTCGLNLEERLDTLFKACETLNGGKALPIRVGIYPDDIEIVPVSTACDRAKFACDAMRSTITSGYNYYSQELLDDAERRQYIITNLDRAIAEKWVQVYYQPIVRALNGQVCDEEALSRWIDPKKGFLSPGDFIPILEDARIIYKLDLYVLEQALEKLKRQRDAGLHLVPQSINLSRSDFDVCDIVEEIRARVDASGFGRDMITIEITESIIGGDFEFMKTQVARFQALGFAVWMDDFGSGYSSLDVLQSIPFDLIKFDMGFMKKLDEGDKGKVVLSELVKMVTSLDIDTVCEGVEYPEQVRFLQEIGVAKLQGFYYCKPIPLSEIFARYREGRQIGFENPAESAYFDAIGRVNLFDLAVIANEDESVFRNFFNTLPMAILELRGDQVRIIRSNQSYRDFMKRFFSLRLNEISSDFNRMDLGSGDGFMKLVKECCENGTRAFHDDKMPDGSTVHSFARRIAYNPVTNTSAAAVAILSITSDAEGATYASIARALASDYYNIYYVDLRTDDYIEYSSPVGGEGLAVERQGSDFFAASRQEAERVYAPDREIFYTAFTKENILRELEQQGAFNTTYRLMDSGKPVY